MNDSRKISENEKESLWIRIRFYVLILLATALLLTLLIILNKASMLKENIFPALISLANALSAYSISKYKNKDAGDYEKIMKQVFIWTIFRFVAMTVLILTLILSNFVEPVSFIFSFIGFYIIHQVIEIRILQLENK